MKLEIVIGAAIDASCMFALLLGLAQLKQPRFVRRAVAIAFILSLIIGRFI